MDEMDDRIAQLEAATRAVQERLQHIERRLAALEPGGRSQTVASQDGRSGEAAAEPAGGRTSDLVTILSLAGRSLIVLGGAYLLRALTEAGALPPLAGSLLALAYALTWLFGAGRSAARGLSESATFHGLTASAIGFPLVWETTVRFGFFGPTGSAMALGALTGCALFVAWRWPQRALAWTATLAALMTSLVLVPATDAPLPYAVVLVLLGIATLWLGYVRDWRALRWPVAVLADIAAIGLVTRALTETPRESPEAVLAFLLLLLGSYLASIGVRTLIKGRNVIAFEVVQTAAALVVSLWGLASILRVTGLEGRWFGAGFLCLGVASYAVSLAFVDRRQGRGANFYFYTTLALVFTVVGTTLVLPTSGVAVVCALLGVAATAAGGRLGRWALEAHAAVYLLVASVASGLFGDAARSLLGSDVAALRLPGPSGLASMACLTVAVLWAVSGRGGAVVQWARPARLLILALFLWCAGGAVVHVAKLGLSGAFNREVATAELALVRTVVVAATALILALLASRLRVVEAGWLVYPVLLLGGIKVLQDLRTLRPSLLVITLAAYGAALILAPRWLRGRSPSAAGERSV